MSIFGTDGVRGIANQSPMTPETAMALGRATAHLFCRRSRKHLPKSPKVVIGKDTRLSGYMFENALSAGFCSMGARVFLVGPLPTPGIAFITRSMRADAGVVISASHNTFQYNGIKIFDRHGMKLPDEKEAEIEALLESKELNEMRPTNDAVGRAMRIEDAMGRYIVATKDTFPTQYNLEGIRVVLDCANGACYKIAPIIFEELGADVFPIHNTPNGENINEACGAVHPQAMCRSVVDHRAEIGIALDGDGDRVVLADENGEIVDGDQILAICGRYMIEKGLLKNNTVVVTPMSNLGLLRAIEEVGGKTEIAKVGDRYIVEKMFANDYNLGGEQSGHIVFSDYNTTGDGILAALKVLAIMRETGKPLSKLKKVMEHYPQVLENVFVRNKEPFEEHPQIVAVIKKVEDKLKNKGRVLVRYSGTEPLARVMVEGEDAKKITTFAAEIAHQIKSELG